MNFWCSYLQKDISKVQKMAVRMTTDTEWRTAQRNITAQFGKEVTEGRYDRCQQNQQYHKAEFEFKNLKVNCRSWSAVLTKHKRWVSSNKKCLHQWQICLWRFSQSEKGLHLQLIWLREWFFFFQIDNYCCIQDNFNRPQSKSLNDLL